MRHGQITHMIPAASTGETLPRTIRRSELVADQAIHMLGLGAAAVAVPVLLALAISRDGAAPILGVSLYGAGLLAMVGCSALYHLRRTSPRRELYRRLDHAAIFVMIAGTYSPLTLGPMPAMSGTRLFVFVWTVAAAGAALKLLFPRRLERLSLVIYLALGWSVLAALDALLPAVPMGAVALLVVGGGLYTLGVVFHLWYRLPYQNAIWHALVLAAAGCHYAAVLVATVLPNAAA